MPKKTYAELEKEVSDLSGELIWVYQDLAVSKKETLKWKRLAQALYKLWKEKKSIVESDAQTLIQISRRMQSHSERVLKELKIQNENFKQDFGERPDDLDEERVRFSQYAQTQFNQEPAEDTGGDDGISKPSTFDGDLR